MNLKRLTLFFACALAPLAARAAVHDQPALATRAQETAARPSGAARVPAELLRAVEGEGQNDAESWFRLGLAQDAAGDLDAALEAFRRAVKLRPDFGLARAGVAYVLYEQDKFAEAETEIRKALPHTNGRADVPALSAFFDIRTGRQAHEAALELAKAERELAKNPNAARWHLRRAEALLAAGSSERKPRPFASYFEQRPAAPTPPADENTRRASREAAIRTYEDAAASLDKYLRLKPDADDGDYLRGQLEALRYHARGLGGDAPSDGKVFNTFEVNPKAVIVSKPDPGFTEESRRNRVNGVVRLRAVLAADGQVKHILVIRGLPDGLSRRAVEAARRIRFRPARSNGVPVSQWIVLEYNFSVY